MLGVVMRMDTSLSSPSVVVWYTLTASKLERREFILAYGVRGIESTMMGLTWQKTLEAG